MKKLIAQALSLALIISLITPIPTLPSGGDTPPDEEPGISVCGDGWSDSSTQS